MRRYDDPVDVRRGRVNGTGGDPVEGPEQFVWKGRLWAVRTVLAQWVETGAWWHSTGARAALGEDRPADGASAEPARDPGSEREVWRVEAARGMTASVGVFDLAFDWSDGSWRLDRCLD